MKAGLKKEIYCFSEVKRVDASEHLDKKSHTLDENEFKSSLMMKNIF